MLRIESEGGQHRGSLIDVSDGERENGIDGSEERVDGEKMVADITNAQIEAEA